MTLLHYEDLQGAIAAPLEDRLVVAPLLSPSQVGSASIDLRLGTEFLLLKRTESAGLDPRRADIQTEILESQDLQRIPMGGEPLWLHPNQFVLGATLEYVRMPNHLAGYLLGRSSWARVGLIVATALMVQPGFAGNLTLELVNMGESPVGLYPGLRIAQLAVHLLPSKTEHPYMFGGGKYVAPIGPEATKLAWEEDELRTLKRIGTTLNYPLVPNPPAQE